MTIILISTKTLIKKKKRELRREDCVQTLWNIFGTFQVYLEVIISCAKKKCCNFKLKTSGWCTTTLAPTLILTRPSVQILKKPGTTNCSELVSN